MHLTAGARQLLKRTLSVTRVKLVYERITLTRFTALYFICAILTCVLLSSLQILGLAHDSDAVSILSSFIEDSTPIPGLAILKGNAIELCSGLPNVPGAVCKEAVTFQAGFGEWQWGNISIHKFLRDDQEDPSDEPQEACVVSIKWLHDVLHDDQREDVVTFLFQIWLFVLSLVTILNESIPHLGAAFFGNMLSTAWAGYRVYSTRRLMNLYQNDIVPKACNGRDFLGNWWESRVDDTIPLVALDGAALVALSYLSLKLFKVYSTQTRERVGASPKVQRIYELVLVFSVFLQLSGFITIASTGMWIDKAVHGTLAEFASHTELYLAAFILILVLQLPWLIFGWICVRKECNFRFTCFCLVSVLLLGISIAMFAGDLYRYIFSSWPFFATITVTAFILMVGTTILAVICRLNFGQGLAHYIQVTEALEGVDFTPVYFSSKRESDDIEKSGATAQNLEFPVPLHSSQKAPTRGDSIYSDSGAAPIMMSASPLPSKIAPAARKSEFLKTLKKFSLYAPSFSEKGARLEQVSAKNSAVPSISTLPRLQTTVYDENTQKKPGATDQDSQGNSRISKGPFPVETTSPLSYLPSKSSIPHAENIKPTMKRPQKGALKVGLPANPRARVVKT